MAALRHGIRTVIIPADNERDLEEIDQAVRSRLHFVIARHVDTVLETALVPMAPVSAPILPEMAGERKARHQKPGIQQ